MKKKDIVPVILLALLIPAWMLIDQKLIAPKFPAAAPQAAQPADTPPEAGTIETATMTDAAQSALSTVKAAVPEAAAAPLEETINILENDKVRLQLTSLGAGIKAATLFEYPEFDEPDSPPVEISFNGSTALAYDKIDGITEKDSVGGTVQADGKSIVYSKALANDIVFQRTITLGDGYLMTVNDRFINNGSSDQILPASRITTGVMKNPADMKATKGVSILGVDSFTPATGTFYWGRKLNGLFKDAGKPEAIDSIPEGMLNNPVNWISTKNKFFVQILSPEYPIGTMSIICTRDMFAKGILPDSIAAALALPPATIAAGNMVEQNYTFLIGPKKYSTLADAGDHMEAVMEFETTGFFSFMNWLMEPARKSLLWTLNKFYGLIPNYGVAIILLTILVRILFWPLTHKSTESMRRMQEIQPEIKALQAKHKENPQRMQQETMKLYKEKKVNPMGGCLPMVIQIPVFIALFTVLRNAIELRYASFLWVSDLSMPENLFAGQIPFVGSLNILPLLMSASMILQQKMTPTAATTPEQQQQQKMMMFMMPIMMLFFFYSMPSGLVLYWTTSNLLMIVQTSLRNLKKAKPA